MSLKPLVFETSLRLLYTKSFKFDELTKFLAEMCAF